MVKKVLQARPGVAPLGNSTSLWRRILAAGLSTLLLGFPGMIKAEGPVGVFSIANLGNPISPVVLANRDVDGVSVRTGWADIEPTEGDFDWSYLDSTVAAAGAADKEVLLRIGTMSGRPGWVDEAVEAAGGDFFVFEDDGVTTSIPRFWDHVFLRKKKAMIAALGAHFGNNPTVTVVCTSFANATSEDWNVPHTSEDIAQWRQLGYTTDKMLDAGQQIIDAVMVAFPTQSVNLAVGGTGGGLDPGLTYLATTITAIEKDAWPGRLSIQKNSLSTYIGEAPGKAGSTWRLLWNNVPETGAQMIYRCVNDETYKVNNGIEIKPALALTKSIDLGLTYDLSYIEIYQADVVSLPGVISYAHEALTER